MPRDTRLWVDDVLEACERIRAYVADCDFDAFMADTRTSDAVLRNLEIVGEAVKKLPSELLAQAPHVPWSDVAGFRDILAHAYFRVDLTLVWDILQHELPALEEAARQLGAIDDES
jgi:uncharacterized protein with HEPN domain